MEYKNKQVYRSGVDMISRLSPRHQVLPPSECLTSFCRGQTDEQTDKPKDMAITIDPLRGLWSSRKSLTEAALFGSWELRNYVFMCFTIFMDFISPQRAAKQSNTQ